MYKKNLKIIYNTFFTNERKLFVLLIYTYYIKNLEINLFVLFIYLFILFIK